jgi:hypothetical protein
MGGMATVIFSANHPEIKAFCPISPVYQMAVGSYLETKLENWKETGWFSKESSKYGPIKIPFAFIEDSNKFNALNYVEKAHQPSLFILGHSDIDVYPQTTKTIFLKAKQPKQLIEIDKLDHHYNKNPEMIKIVNKYVIDFFNKYL